MIFVCWSGDIIRIAFSSNGLDGLHIHSNELAFVESISSGGIDRHVESPIDKLKIFNNIWSILCSFVFWSFEAGESPCRWLQLLDKTKC